MKRSLAPKSDNESQISGSCNDGPPPNVRPDHWERLQKIRAQRQELTNKQRKQKTTKNVNTSKQSETKSNKRAREQTTTVAATSTAATATTTTTTSFDKACVSGTPFKGTGIGCHSLKELAPFMGTLTAVQRTGFENEGSSEEAVIENAIAKGDFKTAVAVSDSLAVKNVARNISTAISAREYSLRQQEQREKQRAKKRPKLNWGFESLERWERKGNM